MSFLYTASFWMMLSCFASLYIYLTEDKDDHLYSEPYSPITQPTPLKTLYYITLCIIATIWFVMDVTNILPTISEINHAIGYRMIIVGALSFFAFTPLVANTFERDKTYRLCYYPVAFIAHVLAVLWVLSPSLFYYGSPLFNFSIIVVVVQILLATFLLKALFWAKY